MISFLLRLGSATLLLAFGCSQRPIELTQIAHFPVDNLDGLVSADGIAFDSQVSADGNGAIMVSTTEPQTVRLFEVKEPGIDNARLVYRAKVRTEGVSGRVYLEVLCHFPGMGEFFSRSLDHTLTGDTEWSTEETLFFLKPGETPDRVSLNLVVDGTGTVWIDDIQLLKGPLNP